MKDNRIKLKRVQISKYSLGRELGISCRDYDKNFNNDGIVLGYEVLNGDYKGSVFVEEGYPTYYAFMGKKPVKYLAGNAMYNGDLVFSENWVNKVLDGSVRIRAFDTAISYSYMNAALHHYVASIQDAQIIVDTVPSFKTYIEQDVKNYPSVALTNSGHVHGFVPFTHAVTRAAKQKITTELATRGYVMNTERIGNYIASVKENVKRSMLELREENEDFKD